jgi:hypothetical protein
MKWKLGDYGYPMQKMGCCQETRETRLYAKCALAEGGPTTKLSRAAAGLVEQDTRWHEPALNTTTRFRAAQRRRPTARVGPGVGRRRAARTFGAAHDGHRSGMRTAKRAIGCVSRTVWDGCARSDLARVRYGYSAPVGGSSGRSFIFSSSSTFS